MVFSGIEQDNVGRIAERIVANDLEFRGFRVSDLDRDRTSANADLLAVRDKKTFQIQVKGASNTSKDRWFWVQFGYCDQDILDRNGEIFNRVSSFYQADIVVLVTVRSPKEYSCVVLPVEIAEQAAQINLDRDFRILARKGHPKKPHKVWTYLDYIPKSKDVSNNTLYSEEQKLLEPYRDKWEVLQ